MFLLTVYFRLHKFEINQTGESNASNQRAKYNNITLLQQSRRDRHSGRDVKKKQRQKTKNAQRSRRDEGAGRDAKILNAKLQRDTTNLLIARLPTQRTNQWPTKSNDRRLLAPRRDPWSRREHCAPVV